MTTVKTADLIGPALDWAVAKSEGHDIVVLTAAEQEARWFEHVDADKLDKERADFNQWVRPTLLPIICVRGEDGYKRRPTHQEAVMLWGQGLPVFAYSTSWAQAGPIIERETICLLAFGMGLDAWSGSMSRGPSASRRVPGPTPLIAAMRCYVASKQGNSVDIPDELS